MERHGFQMGISNVLSLLCGVALFLFGMSLMGDGLKKVAGNKLELTLYKLTNTPIKGVLLGTLVTAVIQSSSATTVMVVGFVNAGMMKVAQAIGIIMGANIGTSVTGWILCLSYMDSGASGIAAILSTATISAVVAIVGIIFKTFSKKDVLKNVGDIMMGFAILMTGMQMMSSAVSPLKESEAFLHVLTTFSNPVIGILVGIGFTAVLQSASASVGIMQALSITGGITFATALPITMGIGVGAACPVLLSSIGTNKNGKRTALIYLLNDLFGMIFWSIVFYSVNAFVNFDFMDTVMDPVLVAALNSVFRIATICVLLPFIKLIEKLVYVIVKDDPQAVDDEPEDFDLLEERFLNYPDLAITQCKTVIESMANKSKKNVARAMSLLKEFSNEKYSKVQEKEDLIDKYEDKLGTYLMQLTSLQLTAPQSMAVTKYLRTINDFERLSDHAVNISNIAVEMKEKKISFSEKAQSEMDVLCSAIKEIVTLSNECFNDEDLSKAKNVEPLREVIDMICSEMKSGHISRLKDGKCDLRQGFVFNDLLANYERIAAHCSNIAIAVIESDSSEIDPHEYLLDLHERKNGDYTLAVESYAYKYSLRNSKKKNKS